MHDIRAIKENPEAFETGMRRRGLDPELNKIIKASSSLIEAKQLTERLNAERNMRSEQLHRKAIDEVDGEVLSGKFTGSDKERRERIAYLSGSYGRALAKEAGAKAASAALSVQTRQVELDQLLHRFPNLPLPDVPDGPDESGNVEQKAWGEKPAFAFTARDHADLGPALGLDFEAGARLSGARFTVLRGPAAKLHRALGQFMLDAHAANGHEEVAPPLLVRDEAMFGTGQLPKFADDLFRTTDGRWLIPTAEVSLTNLAAGQIVPASALPMRLTALTPCFRAEAGAAGRDTRGLIRQHQFDKVELVTLCAPEDSAAEHERMTRGAESILEALGLPYRRMLLCAGDMGFAARKTYDLEVWLPGQGLYREISSCSDCGDFQARRMEARYRPEGGKPAYLHTLNGSGLAVGRTLVAVIENYQDADGGVRVPEALRPYLGGAARLEPA